MAVRFRIDQLRRLYPALAGLDLQWRECGEGVAEDGKEGRLSLAESNLVGRLPCANPTCTKGGYELTEPLYDPLEERATEAGFRLECPGYVGAVRSEKGPARCENAIEAEVGIIWKD